MISDVSPAAPAPQPKRARFGLSARLMGLTILFALIAEILIYIPSVANFRTSWLNDRIAQARAAALILEKAPPDALPKALVDELLEGMETTMIALRIDQSRRLLAISDMPPMVAFEIDLRAHDRVAEIASAFNILFMGNNRAIRVVGPAPRGGEFVEIVLNEAPLRAAMIAYSWAMLRLSLIIAGIAAVLVFAALSAFIVRPVTRIARLMAQFRQQPEAPRHLITPSHRTDEIGALEHSLAEMQASLQQQLRQREHLASLGLAVAKINHDLRNMLASAQLMADRLGALPDPNVQRFVPRLLDALDRAIGFCQSTLAYGRGQERAPQLERLLLAPFVQDVTQALDLGGETGPELKLDIPASLTVEADAEHLSRVFTNLLRNARVALEQAAEAGQNTAPRIHISARSRGDQVEIAIADNGPGIPAALRDSLFKAFSGSTAKGGSGLGLAIAHELIRAMGGTIALLPAQEGARGTTFRLTLPAQ